MNTNNILQLIVAKHFNKQIDEINLNSSADNIDDWDSLEHIKLVLEIETEFNVKFALEVIPKITSIKLIQEELEKLINE